MDQLLLLRHAEHLLLRFKLHFGEEFLHEKRARGVFGMEGNDVRGGKVELLVVHEERRQLGEGVGRHVGVELPTMNASSMSHEVWL